MTMIIKIIGKNRQIRSQHSQSFRDSTFGIETLGILRLKRTSVVGIDGFRA